MPGQAQAPGRSLVSVDRITKSGDPGDVRRLSPHTDGVSRDTYMFRGHFHHAWHCSKLLSCIISFDFRSTLDMGSLIAPFTPGVTEARGGEVRCPGPHSEEVVASGSGLGYPAPA